jgi:hypothetical protein
MALKRGGRPRKYRNAQQLQEKIVEYFEHCEQHSKPYTLVGLSTWLGFATTKTFNYYGKHGKARAHFSRTIGMARLVIEAQKSEMLVDSSTSRRTVRALIFDLRNNFGWKVKPNPGKTESRGIKVIGFEEWNRQFPYKGRPA